jgi:phosphonate transport system permease protein
MRLDRTYPEPAPIWLSGGWRFALVLLAVLAVYAAGIHLAQFDLQKFFTGLPRMAGWAAKAWPPDFSEMDLLFYRAAETVAIALVGTTIGVLVALPLSLLAAANVTPNRLLYHAARWVMNVLRGIDSFIFAILFVAAVGLGPFAGVMGVALHAAGAIAKLWAEAIEAVEPGPMEAVTMTGANRIKVLGYALLPDILPIMTSIAIYAFEYNVRSSAVLGLVGAGGIGQELKNAVDLLNFPRLFTILMIIVVMVTIIDQLSAFVRRRLV